MLPLQPVKVSFDPACVQSTLAFGGAPPKLSVVMARLAQLLASHRRILLLDAASARVTVGLLQAGQAGIWSTIENEAGRAVFSGAAEVLGQARLRLDDVAAFLFCEGPGSTLGTRTVAMSLRTWQALRARPAYAYQSLAVAARAEWKRRPRSFAVIADARRESWHVQSISAKGVLAPLQRCAATDLPAGERLTPAHFRVWSKLPAGAGQCDYDPSAFMDAADDSDLFAASVAPDAFQHESPDYRKWSAHTHSAETAARKT